MVKRSVLVCFLSVGLCTQLPAQDLDVYVTAHPDDWQLFMNPNAYLSLKKDNTKVMFLHTTAGDAGSGMDNDDYTLAREEGSFRAIRFLVNAKNGGKGIINKGQRDFEVNGHKIRRFDYDNAIVIFMRLPDGNYYGPGYDKTGNSSMFKLYNGEIKSITAVDSSTTYSSKKDLIETITELIKSESPENKIELNIADTDSIINPEDHSDHRFSSYFMQDVARELELDSLRLYTEYETSNKPLNVEGELFLISAGCWGATASGLSDSGHYSTWDAVHNAWIGRQYYRKAKLSDLRGVKD